MAQTFLFSTILLLLCICASHPFEYYVQNFATDGSLTNFGYHPDGPNSPANWYRFAPFCGGLAQSPINIRTKATTKIGKQSGDLLGSKWTEKPIAVQIDNNGQTILMVFTYADQAKPSIYLYGAVYEFSQLHFHFGLNSKSGSEHYINNRGYAMEGHAVFYNLLYQSMDEALLHPDGLVVIGRLYDEINHHAAININFEFLRYVHNPNQSFTIDGRNEYEVFSLDDIMGPLNLPSYLYHGSLTTPGCNEVVTWYLATKPLRISSLNVYEFRQVVGNEGLMAPNVRPLQNINERTIYYRKGGH